MTFHDVIEKILPEVRNGSETPFRIFRADGDDWRVGFANGIGENYDWVAGTGVNDPYAVTFTGKDFANASYPNIIDKVLIARLQMEYQDAQNSGVSTNKLRVLLEFCNENIGALSPEAADYLIDCYRPLATLDEVLPSHLIFGSELDVDHAEEMIALIENHVEEHFKPQVKEKRDKHNIEGYEETLSVQIGSRRILFAELPTSDKPYFISTIRWDNFLGIEEYSDGIATDGYVEAIRIFAKRIDALAEVLENERRESGLPIQTLTVADCMEGSQHVEWEDGELIIVRPEALAPEYRSAEHQLALCLGGFGASPDGSGRAVFVKELYSGKEYRYNRPQIAGLADLAKLPTWAKDKLAEHHRLNEALKEPSVFQFGGYHFKPYRKYGKGEILKNKTVTDRALGKMESDFELGLSTYDWQKAGTDYSHEKFYLASGSSEADVFQCIENGKLYVPGENELFLYKGLPIKERHKETEVPAKKPTLQARLDSAKQKSAQGSITSKDNRSDKPTKLGGRE